MSHDAAPVHPATPPSRLLRHLAQEAATTQDPRAWARAVCLAAAHQACRGQPADAPVSLEQVRTACGPGLHPEVACWLILSEGILQWCLSGAHRGYARMRGAHALAMAVGADAAACCAAWMALLEFEAGQYDRMIEHLTEVFEHARAGDHLARAKAALVIACCHHLVRNDRDARQWYQRCRQLCATVGDEATTGAVFHSMARGHLAQLRLQDAFGRVEARELDQVRQEVSNTVTFDLMTGNNIRQSWNELLQARLALLAGEPAQARDHYRKALTSDLSAPCAIGAAVELAWCEARLAPDQVHAIWDDIRIRYPSFPEKLATDERACVEMRMAALAELADAKEEHANHLSRAQAAQAAHARFCEELRPRIAVFG